MESAFKKQAVFIAAMLLLCSFTINAQSIRYVKPGGSGSHNGLSWDSASGDLQAMINTGAGEIWVAEGTYQLISNQSIAMRSGTKILGGFPNNNGNPGTAQRNPAMYVTILKGSNVPVISNNGNSLTATAVLDGFTITGGNPGSGNGGGMYNFAVSPTISNCIFTGNTATGAGGGMYNRQSSPIVINCTFSKNTAGNGAGMYNDNNGFSSVSPIVTNCVFSENQSTNGGAVYVTGSSTAKYFNCTFSKNRATAAGGALYNLGNAQVNNCIFWNNFSTANTGSELFSSGGTITSANSLINISATSVQGSLNHQNTITGDPLFSYPAGNVFSLMDGSPAKDTGNTALYANAATSMDMAGNPRVYGSQIDLGPYETGLPFSGNVRYVKKGGAGNGSSWQYAMGNLQEAINASTAGNEVWVAHGTYQPEGIQAYQMKEGVRIYGGFPANDNTAGMEQRNFGAHPAILKAGTGSVISSNSLTSASLLDGFTITGNQSTSVAAMFNSGGSPTITNCVFSNNTSGSGYGGGMLNYESSPVISDCTFKDNSGGFGAGMYNLMSSPVISRCIFRNNSTSGHGSAMYNDNSSPVITNCIFNNNQGTLYNFGSGMPKFINVTFTQNIGTLMENNGNNSSQLYNCILWGNGTRTFYSFNGSSVTANNCLFTMNSLFAAGTFTQQNTISGNPLFMDAANYNFTLHGYSPAVNSGNTALYPGAALAADIAGNARVTGPKIDIGAYESPYLWPAAGNVHYVKMGGTGNGSSWDFASGSLQDMISYSESGHEVWVAAGTYYPTDRAGNGTDERDKSIVLKNNVNVYGGFAGAETAREQRNWITNSTILSGDLGLTGDDADNAYHVVTSAGAVGTATLDGFTITRGNANGSGQVLVNGIVLNRNDGGGLSTVASSPSIVNCVFTANIASNRGGATFSDGAASLPKYNNCLINGNSSSNAGGAACAVNGANPAFVNCTIAGNFAFYNGGGVYTNLNGAATLNNSILWNNTAILSTGHQVYAAAGSSVTAAYSTVKNGTNDIVGTLNGTNMLNSDPLFASGSFTLMPASPAIDAGSTALLTGAETSNDLAGNPRLLGSAIDMGAYEVDGECAITTTWSGGAWSHGAPGSYRYNAVIAGDYNSGQNGTITACSLTVNSGNVVAASGDNFLLKGSVQVSGGSLVFENNANLIQTTEAVNTGNISVKREAMMRRGDYVYWGAPVTGQLMQPFSQHTLSNRFYIYSETSNAFVHVANPAATEFVAPQGYMVRAPNNFLNAPAAPQLFEGTFTGIPNNGTKTIAVTATTGGYNMLGNPYPSPISADLFLAQNPGTLYFWAHVSADGTTESNYAVYNTTGYAAANGIVPNGTIQTGQGFLLHKSVSGTATFTNAMRAANNAGQFFRSAPSDKSRYWLNLSNNNTVVSQMLVGYLAGATSGIDDGMDGRLAEGSGSNIASRIENINYTIQARPLPFAETDVVPLHFNAGAAGTYTIEIDHVDGIFAEQDILLKDGLTGTIHNLKTGAYNFASAEGSFADRFVVLYQDSTLAVDIPAVEGKALVVYNRNNLLHVDSGADLMSSVKVFDMRGRLIYQRNDIGGTTIALMGLNAAAQVLLIQVTGVDGKVVTRKAVY